MALNGSAIAPGISDAASDFNGEIARRDLCQTSACSFQDRGLAGPRWSSWDRMSVRGTVEHTIERAGHGAQFSPPPAPRLASRSRPCQSARRAAQWP